MDETKKHTPGPYFFEAVSKSHDVNIVSGDRTLVARVLSKESGHDAAPADEVAIQNLALLTHAPRMRDALEIDLNGNSNRCTRGSQTPFGDY